ncbi:hypothetical protein [Cytobacillus sp. FSL H8-0458]|uniref:hypothetical protein n=1 Tax=Cytobacillus sp. FSL H8-0458 TaxID=2975346 RepID=UPI0030FA3A7E
MSAIFGSVEYFERKIGNYLAKKQINDVNEKQLFNIAAQLEYEIRNDFICHERIKKECLENLFKVYSRISSAE